MIKPIIVFILWLLTLGLADVEIKWADGWKIKLVGWPSALRRWLKKRACG